MFLCMNTNYLDVKYDTSIGKKGEVSKRQEMFK